MDHDDDDHDDDDEAAAQGSAAQGSPAQGSSARGSSARGSSAQAFRAQGSFFGPGGEQRFRTEVARVTAGADATGTWLMELRPLLRQLVDYDAGWLGRFDAAADRYLPLLEDGDVEPLRRLFASDVAVADVRQLGFRQAGWPMLGHAIAEQLAPLEGWTTYLQPAGFHDGLGVGLLTSDGRHVGYLTLLSYRPGSTVAIAAALLHAVNPLVADAVDRVSPRPGAPGA